MISCSATHTGWTSTPANSPKPEVLIYNERLYRGGVMGGQGVEVAEWRGVCCAFCCKTTSKCGCGSGLHAPHSLKRDASEVRRSPDTKVRRMRQMLRTVGKQVEVRGRGLQDHLRGAGRAHIGWAA